MFTYLLLYYLLLTVKGQHFSLLKSDLKQIHIYIYEGTSLHLHGVGG